MALQSARASGSFNLIGRVGALAALAGAALLYGCNRAQHQTGTASKPTVVVPIGGAGAASQASLTDPKAFPKLDDAWQDAGYRLDWVGFPFVGVTTPGAIRQFAAFDDVVVAQNSASEVSLLDSKTGQLRWSLSLDAPLTKFVGIIRHPQDASRLVVSSETEATMLAVTSGNMLSRERFARVVNTAPVSQGSTLVYGTAVGEVLAHRLTTGLKSWGFLCKGTINANPVRVGDFVGTVTQEGDVTFLDPLSGTLNGRAKIFGGLANNPAATEDSLIIAGLDQSVWAIAPNGAVRWRHRTPHQLRAQPSAHGGTAWVEIPDQGLTAFEVATGKALWSSRLASGTVIARRGDRLYSYAKDTLFVLDATRGDILKSVPLTGIVNLYADKFENGSLYAVSDRNLVAKLTAR